VTPKSAEEKKRFPHTHDSHVRVVLCFSAAPTAATPLSPMLFPERLCGKRKAQMRTTPRAKRGDRNDRLSLDL